MVRAAISLLQRGENPSVRNIRHELGDTGSPNTIQEHLTSWREDLKAESLSVLPPSLPQNLIEPLEALFAIAVQEAEKNYQRERQTGEAHVAKARQEVEQWRQRALNSENERQDTERSLNELQRRFEELQQKDSENRQRLLALEQKSEQQQSEAAKAQERLILQLQHEQEERRRDRETSAAKLAAAEDRLEIELKRSDDQQLHWIRQVDMARAEVTDARAQIQVIERRHDGELLLSRKREEALSHRLAQAENLQRKAEREATDTATQLSAAQDALQRAEQKVTELNNQIANERERSNLQQRLVWQTALAKAQTILNQKELGDEQKSLALNELLQNPIEL